MNSNKYEIIKKCFNATLKKEIPNAIIVSGKSASEVNDKVNELIKKFINSKNCYIQKDDLLSDFQTDLERQSGESVLICNYNVFRRVLENYSVLQETQYKTQKAFKLQHDKINFYVIPCSMPDNEYYLVDGKRVFLDYCYIKSTEKLVIGLDVYIHNNGIIYRKKS